MAGPSTIPTQAQFDYGVTTIAGSAVVEAESAKMAVKGGRRDIWRVGIKKFVWSR